MGDFTAKCRPPPARDEMQRAARRTEHSRPAWITLADGRLAAHVRRQWHRVPLTESDGQDGEEMPQGGRPDEAAESIASRRDALRQAAGLAGADLGTLIEAALT